MELRLHKCTPFTMVIVHGNKKSWKNQFERYKLIHPKKKAKKRNPSPRKNVISFIKTDIKM